MPADSHGFFDRSRLTYCPCSFAAENHGFAKVTRHRPSITEVNPPLGSHSYPHPSTLLIAWLRDNSKLKALWVGRFYLDGVVSKSTRFRQAWMFKTQRRKTLKRSSRLNPDPGHTLIRSLPQSLRLPSELTVLRASSHRLP